MSNIILFGDCRESLRTFATLGMQAQTCVTSPPYFGLRDYDRDGQIGLEKTVEEYVEHLVEVFRCVRDVLRDDGTLWLNLGDSYAGGRGGARDPERWPKQSRNNRGAVVGSKDHTGFKDKQLLMVPARVAMALQADGWYLRQEIIWAKPNPMPESVKDRCTKSHEKIYLLAKSPTYYFDSEAIEEPTVEATRSRMRQNIASQRGSDAVPGKRNGTMKAVGNGVMRKKRDVWTVNVAKYRGAHFAVFPPALIEPCILAGSKAGDTVLDPFMGSGTTAAVAVKHGRSYLGCELNKDYDVMQQERLK